MMMGMMVVKEEKNACEQDSRMTQNRQHWFKLQDLSPNIFKKYILYNAYVALPWNKQY
jgi:hypothetical protein